MAEPEPDVDTPEPLERLSGKHRHDPVEHPLLPGVTVCSTCSLHLEDTRG